ncbi:MAG: transposase [Spirochaetaceae bacterium]|nr:transposase [Spirochaetaceae bacterium]
MRKPRQLIEGSWYHVTARANRKELIFDSGRMMALFEEVVKRAKKKYRFRVENFCVLGNHFHLVIKPGRGESLSAIMRWIMSVFAMSYNRCHGLTGHVWGERFFSRAIAGLRDFFSVFEYVDENPVKANQVQSRDAWRHGGLFHAVAGRRDLIDEPPEWIGIMFPSRGPLLLDGGCDE